MGSHSSQRAKTFFEFFPRVLNRQSSDVYRCHRTCCESPCLIGILFVLYDMCDVVLLNNTYVVEVEHGTFDFDVMVLGHFELSDPGVPCDS